MWSRTVPSAVTAGVLAVVGALALSTPSAADGGHKIKMLDEAIDALFADDGFWGRQREYARRAQAQDSL